MKPVTECPVCRSQASSIFLRRDQVPVCQNRIIRSEEESTTVGRGQLGLACCSVCGFVYNSSFDPSRLPYGPDYDNSQTSSPHFNSYISGILDYLLERGRISNAHIIEIGCGNGHFLRSLLERDASNRGTGFDPSYQGPLAGLDGRLSFEQRYYDETCAGLTADVVICRHVIEHIPKPRDLLTTTRRALAHSPRALVFFETPNVEWILRLQVIWDFFYEHCSYFSAGSLATAFVACGFRIERVKNAFGGQYLWLEAVPEIDGGPGLPEVDGSTIARSARQFAAAERQLVAQWTARLREMASEGPVALWGAAAKGATFGNLVDPNRELITCVVDSEPQQARGILAGHGPPDRGARGVDRPWGPDRVGAESQLLCRESGAVGGVTGRHPTDQHDAAGCGPGGMIARKDTGPGWRPHRAGRSLALECSSLS